MKLSSDKGNFLSCVAQRANILENVVDDFLKNNHITQSPIAATPRRLTLKCIRFSGVKDCVESPGAFEFKWDNLSSGLWGMVTDGNLKGKSSVIEVAHGILKGRTSGIQDDVRQWINMASLRFELDETCYEIKVEFEDGPNGVLSKLNSDGKCSVLATFKDEAEFETIMSVFFMREFSLETIFRCSEQNGGKTTVHGWPALSGVMFIGTDYSSLLGDITATSGLATPLMQMYLGLPWISTLTAVKTLQQSSRHANKEKERYRETIEAAKKNRIEMIHNKLKSKKEELANTLSDVDIRSTLSELGMQLSEQTRAERTMAERLERDSKAFSEAKLAYANDRSELQAHLDSVSAGAIFRKLNPSCCPRCESTINHERIKRENIQKLCSVCGEHIVSDGDSELIRAELESRITASKAAVEKMKLNVNEAQNNLSVIKANVAALNKKIDEFTAKLESFGLRHGIEMEIMALEGRLNEVNEFDVISEDKYNDDTVLVDALVKETDERVKVIQGDLLQAVSERIVYYANRFGMKNLSRADLKGNATLPLTKGGRDTSYSKLTNGEKLRIKVATILAMISVAEAQGVGRHPGLLMIDSPGAQEVSHDDLDELISGLSEVATELGHLQVFVAARTSDAILSHIPKDQIRYAGGNNYLW